MEMIKLKMIMNELKKKLTKKLKIITLARYSKRNI